VPREVNVRELQSLLQADGVTLDVKDRDQTNL
jgi:hypothetical protein